MRRISIVLLFLFAEAFPLQAAGPDTFTLKTHSPSPYTPSYLGNGEIGVSSSALGTLPSECFMAGVFDHAPGDVLRIAAIPAWNGIDVYNGKSWLNESHGMDDYSQTLDMYDAVLNTAYTWAEPDRAMSVKVRMFVSRADPTIGAVRLEITPRFAGIIRVLLPLTAWPEPKRYPLAQMDKLRGEATTNQWAIWYPGYMASVETRAGRNSLSMVSRAAGTGVQVTENIHLNVPQHLQEESIHTQDAAGRAAVEVSFQAEPGHLYVFGKVADIRRQDSKQAAIPGYDWDVLLDRHVRAWHSIWQSDIVVKGDDSLQRIIHSMLFYLMESAGSPYSIPPMGLSSSGYYGHIFWDADTYMFPSLLLLHPDMAKEIVVFRDRTLNAARENARDNGYKGAMFPWEAGPDGTESTPRFAGQNALYENHDNGDVALAQWQYYLATGDLAWLRKYGYPVIRDTAEFWTSRVSYDRQKDRYEIRRVVSVKESLIGVNNDPYTNAVAKKNLELALAASKPLREPADPKWAEISAKLDLPGRDSLLLDYPLEMSIKRAEKLELIHAALMHAPEGAMMGVEFLPILAAEAGDRGLLSRLLPRTYEGYVRAPFDVLAETPHNNNTNFITGAGAFLQQFLYGYTGLRLLPQGLSQKYAPLLPTGMTQLVLHNITVRGRRRDVKIP